MKLFLKETLRIINQKIIWPLFLRISTIFSITLMLIFFSSIKLNAQLKESPLTANKGVYNLVQTLVHWDIENGGGSSTDNCSEQYFVLDADNDDYYYGEDVYFQCKSPGAGYVLLGNKKPGDCNDGDPAIHPGATELANGIDDDCNGIVDDITVTYKFYLDNDGDGYGNAAISVTRETNDLPAGYARENTDCDDENASINPGTIWVIDVDHDNYFVGTPIIQCTSPGTDYVIYINQIARDCNDYNAAANILLTWFKDADNDGFSDGVIKRQCTRPYGTYKKETELISMADDCDDDDAAINPNAIEVLDGIDNDCNGIIDDVAGNFTFYRDADGDSYGNPNDFVEVNTNAAPTGYVSDNTDCNDNNAHVNPGAPEICGNGIDDNCNGQIDENCCNNISGGTTTNITSNSAQLNWTAAVNPKLWQVVYRSTKPGSSWVLLPNLNGSVRSVLLTNLLPNQGYNWRVRARCGTTWTSYSGFINFKTLRNTSFANGGNQMNNRQGEKVEDALSLKTNALLVYPNPSQGVFMLELQLGNLSNSKARIQLTDMAGKIVHTVETKMNNGMMQKLISMPGTLANGNYVVNVLIDNTVYKTRLVYAK